MVTYRTGAGRLLYMITLADAPPGTVHGWNKFLRAMAYTLVSKVTIIPLKKQVVKIRKTEADFDSDVKATLA